MHPSIVRTEYGRVVCEVHNPVAAASDAPVLLFLAAREDYDVARDLIADLPGAPCAVLVRVPFNDPEGPYPSLNHLGLAVGAVAHTVFRGRRVVVAGWGPMALVASAARAPEILRAVLIEPPAWPLEQAAGRGDGGGATVAESVFLTEVFGGKGTRHSPTSHVARLSSRPTPTDVVVGARRGADAGVRPSLFSDAQIVWLRQQANVAVWMIAGAGEDIAGDAPDALRTVLATSLKRVMTFQRPAEQIADRMAGVAPLGARRAACEGPEARAFEAAFRGLNPQVHFAPAAPGADLDCIVVLETPVPEAMTRYAAALRPGGVLLLGRPLGDPGDLEALVAAAGLTLCPPPPSIVPLGVVVVRAVKPPDEPVTKVTIAAMAPSLMDIRTTLPAGGLATDPRLDIQYLPGPLTFRQAASRVLVIQRPATAGMHGEWATLMADFIRRDLLVVIEFDDHPGLVAEIMRGDPLEPEDWDLFRFAHAVQTSTPPLVDLFRTFNPEVREFPNAVFQLAAPPSLDRPERVIYAAVNRGGFAVEVAASLQPAIAQFPETPFLVVGDRDVYDALPTARKQYVGYVPHARYLDLIASSTICLSPLEARPRMETKSDAKYLDASRAGVLTIASPIVYDRVIRHGENGLLATSRDAWSEQLAFALGQPARRVEMAQRAWEEMRDTRMFAHQVEARAAWYADLWRRREALTAALLERCPEIRACL